MKLRTIKALALPTLRATRLPPLTAACVVGLLVFQFTRPEYNVEPILPAVIRMMRVAMLTIALGIPFVLDDLSEETVASAPTRLWIRRALRIALAAPIVAVAWLLLVRYAREALLHPAGLPAGESFDAGRKLAAALPVWGLGRQFLALVVGGLALSALGARILPERIGSFAAMPALVALVGATMLLPRSLTVLVGNPKERLWADAGSRWTIALTVAVAGLWHLCRDPGRPRLRFRILPARPRTLSGPHQPIHAAPRIGNDARSAREEGLAVPSGNTN